ncbi:indolepyruvate ferredoxin oxidoreductase family protein [Sphingobium sp. HWE2-09]|uniref:indolepyruvate ferredoxin oxidoreductase family protein n=1 Tax=Sphingobium sp. HWE2-09 TaxID=3108390 RepID=UPI002DC45446|nr:indolepyruvate ferredoxin oxidoreductase family protein [Sphingobium sp. HWE2-09]
MTLERALRSEIIYNKESGPVLMTGIQALVRLPMAQRRLDRHAGLNTAGLVSGYRGSPLGGYDQQLWKAEKLLADHDVVFQPGLNEDLAATALWGAQMHRAYGPAKVDGIFGIWYGKGPGVDRTGDVFRNANIFGTSALGGVLVVAGDDHAAQSSTFPHQTDGIFTSTHIPILQPADVSEILSLGLAGIALSRFSGLWVAHKAITEVVETASTFTLPPPPIFVTPSDSVPAHGLNWDPGLKWPAQRAELERRLLEERLPAALAWARANRLDAPIISNRRRKLCFVTVGKAHFDLLQAFDDLELRPADLGVLGISVYKVAMSWPLDTVSLMAFTEHFEEIVIVEEKQGIVETQLKEALYHHPDKRRPRISGKAKAEGGMLLPATGEFSAALVASAVVDRLGDAAGDLSQKLAALRARTTSNILALPPRKPYFCAGCPHNSSTKTPEGSVAGAGIGCHGMAVSMPWLNTPIFSQMGGEGMQWVGAQPFSKQQHIFQNLGDGTYQHSGLLAIRAAVAANTPITFKILYNDAVAMTGGQPAEGNLKPDAISRQLAAEGVGHVHLVSDDPEKWQGLSSLAAGTQVHHRDALNNVQRELALKPGVTAIIYEQTCAAEKRRRRKRNQFPDPDRRLFINPRVCEGCGDCSVQSNCIAVEPIETPFGRKRRINQSSCNKDFSCVKGFCPSFVDIEGPVLRKPDLNYVEQLERERFSALPLPDRAGLYGVYTIYISGIGGLGVLTVGALLGAAAYLDGNEATVLDFTGLSQKNGAVVSQIKLAPAGEPIHATRIGDGTADLMIAADNLVAVMPEGQLKFSAGRTSVIVNGDEAPTSDGVMDRDMTLPTATILKKLVSEAKSGGGFSLRSTSIAEGLFGDAVAANVLLLGFAWQKGLIPLSLEAIHGAIRAGVQVKLNERAFAWGRLAAIDLAEVERLARLEPTTKPAESTIELIDRRTTDLIDYQNEAYADRYRTLLGRLSSAAANLGADGEKLVRTVALQAYRVMAFKDEYEVARLYSEPAFMATLSAQFERTGKIAVWLAPPMLSRMDPKTGRPAKRKFGPWVFTLFRLLSRMKGLRGGWADPFGYTSERRIERELRDYYLASMNRVAGELDVTRLKAAQALAELPASVRGFGPVKEAALDAMLQRRTVLEAEYEALSQIDGVRLAKQA